jgi:predicted TPR repeat methyltransferase
MRSTTLAPRRLADVLDTLEAGAAERDRSSLGLDDALAQLASADILAANAIDGESRPPAGEELALVRAVARADSSVGRVLDGHLNGVERLAVQAPAEIAEPELALVRAGLLRVGVWGGNPRPGEGEAARIEPATGAEVLSGVKTFCTGAGSLDRALVLARDPAGEAAGVMAPVAVWIDLRDAVTVRIDPTWYRSSGLRASASHRVLFDRAPVLARVGAAGAITAQPWFGRDALRTAASWAGMADRAVAAALGELAAAPGRGALEEHAVGRMLGAQRTIDVWLAAAARAMDAAAADLWDVALHGRVAIADAARLILAEAQRACGSHPFATGGALDRVRRDLDLFLLQHRLDPPLQRAGAAALHAAAPMTVASAFDQRYAGDADPWGYEHSDYEQAKYAATLTACGEGPFRSALELGASIGVFSAQLAPRCEQLITVDFSAVAVQQARVRLAHQPHVDVRVGEIPADLQDGSHDLIVASEILYYLAPAALEATLDRLEQLLAPGGRIVLVHWRPSGPERPFSAAQVHDRVRALPWLTEQADASTDDYLLHVLVRA